MGSDNASQTAARPILRRVCPHTAANSPQKASVLHRLDKIGGMVPFDEKAAVKIAAAQDNVISLADVRSVGGTKNAAYNRAARTVWQKPQRGVFLHSAASPTFRQRVLAALTYCGDDACASHRTAAFLEGLDGVPEPEIIEITMTQRDRPVPKGVHVYRSRRAITKRRWADGIRVTPIERTLLDCAAVVAVEDVERTVESALLQRLTTEERIYLELVERGGRGVHGARRLWRVMHERPEGRPARSYFEIRTGHALRSGGLGHFVRNYPVSVDGESFELDKAFPDQQVAVESDGRRWHSTRTQRERDRRRQRKLEAAGWRFRRVAYEEILTRNGRAQLVADVKALLTTF